MHPVPPPAAILWDWDGTLVDTLPLIHQCLNAAFAAVDMPPWTLEQVEQGIHRSSRESFPVLFGERWQEAQAVYYETFAARHLMDLQPLAGAADLIQELHRAGIPQGVVSNKRGMFLRAEAAHLGWNGYFTAIVGAGDAAADKPSSAPALLALERLRKQAGASVWFVGDSETDLQTAYTVGLSAVFLRQKPLLREEFLQTRPHLHALNCHALRKNLQDLGTLPFTNQNEAR